MLNSARVSIILPYFERPEVLAITLRSFQALYSDSQIEIVIVDDGSHLEMKPRFPAEFTLPTKLVTILNKDGINPCVPINIGVTEASGEFILLSSPEIVHTESIFPALGNHEVREHECIFFNVFALTDFDLNSSLITSGSHTSFMKIYRDIELGLDRNLGRDGYSWSNSYGSWYSHPVYRRTDLNFLSLMRRDAFLKVGGFDERYRKGSGFDDNEFRRRLLSRSFDFIYRGSSAAIHLIHEEVSTRPDFNIGINSNEKLYKSRFKRKMLRKCIGRAHNYEVSKVNFK
jgi:glycosyltransferase involved in cell wall biosynthesis